MAAEGTGTPTAGDASSASSPRMTASPCLIPSELNVAFESVELGRSFGGKPRRTVVRAAVSDVGRDTRGVVRTSLTSQRDLRIGLEYLLPKLLERAFERVDLEARGTVRGSVLLRDASVPLRRRLSVEFVNTEDSHRSLIVIGMRVYRTVKGWMMQKGRREERAKGVGPPTSTERGALRGILLEMREL